jgi:hypothetical protein
MRSSRWLPALLLLLAVGACAPTETGDSPTTQTAHPKPDLQLTARLDHGRLSGSTPLQLSVELKNTGNAAVAVPAGGPCNPDLQVWIVDTSGQIVWAEAQMMRMCAPQSSTPDVQLAPGQALTGTRCFRLGDSQGQCAALTLQSGTYRVAGNFHNQSLPQVEFRIG